MPVSNAIEAVLLDALGTLIELHPPGPPLVRGLRARHGLEVTQAEAERALLAEMAYYRAHNQGASDPRGVAALRLRCTEVLRAELPPAAHGIDLPELERTLLAALRFEPYPDVRDALDALRRCGHKLVVVSNWDVSLHDVLAETGLVGLLDGVVTSAEVGFAKPEPAIFAAALELVDAAPDRALHVGDTAEDDVAGARAAGIRSVLLDRSAGVQRGRGEVTIASLSELPGLVDGGAPG